MNTHKPRRRVCECGRPFYTSMKFGNERKCAACYAAHRREFADWLKTLSDDEMRETVVRLRVAAAAMGMEFGEVDGPHAPADTTEIHPEQVAHADQAVIDTTFAIIMADMEL